jgi:predicted Zn-dependent protease with MMP-like domain
MENIINHELLTYEEVREYLDEIAEELPEDFYKYLNGGVLLQESTQLSSHALHHDLFTLGTYTNAPAGLGRYITIYYGSFEKVCAGKSVKEQKEMLHEVLLHEFTHHFESLAGLKGLEVKDEQFLHNYYKQQGK